MNEVFIRETNSDDALSIVQRILFEAATWDVEDRSVLPPLEAAVDHPELVIYHSGWGRVGDELVVARVSTEIVGGAYFRLFTDDEHGHGYVDSDTPELAIAVFDGYRGRGLGRRLMGELERVAIEFGTTRLALSVDTDNPASRLYDRCGYVTIEDDGSSLLMVKNLVG